MKTLTEVVNESLPEEKRKLLKNIKGLPEEVTRPFTKAPLTRSEQLKEQKNTLALVDAYLKAKEETDDNPFIFTCPVCGNDAKGGFSPDNGHFRIECKTCNRNIWQ